MKLQKTYDDTKRIVPVAVLKSASRWLDYAATMEDNASARCSIERARDAALGSIESGAHPLTAGWDPYADLHQRFTKAGDDTAGWTLAHEDGSHRVEYHAECDIFRTLVNGKFDGGQDGEAKVEQMERSVEMLESVGLTRQSKALNAVCRKLRWHRERQQFELAEAAAS